MQFNMSFRSLVALALLCAGAYYCYELFFAEADEGDVSKLLVAHRRAEPARQAVIKHRLLVAYKPSDDYQTMFRALDSPSPTTQALAVEVLTAKVERRALPKLLEMLRDPARSELVREDLAITMGQLAIREAVPRLVELTDKSEPQRVRAAAHEALVRITGAGAQVKLAGNTREQWTIWLRDR